MGSKLRDLEDELNRMILGQRHQEAFEKFYADECTMQENNEPPTRGKIANRAREENFFAMLREFHSIELLGCAVGNDISFSEWRNEMTLEGIGRVTTEQTAVRRWTNGRIISERFYHTRNW